MGNKKSKGRVKSKAAQATAAAQQGRGSTSFQPTRSRGGLMTKMRSGFQSAAGSDESAKPPSFMQRALWFVVIAAAVFFFARGL